MIIGLTGGIGSGKSTVAALFAELGAPIIDADDIARELTKPGSEVLTHIGHHFGQDIFTHIENTKILNRSALRERIFNSPNAAADRKFLENLLHPLIYNDIKKWADKIHKTHPYGIAIIPLLIETKEKYSSLYNKILVIDTLEHLQISRIKNRDNLSDEMIKKMIDAQASRADRLSEADDIILNDNTPAHMKFQVKILDGKYKVG